MTTDHPVAESGAGAGGGQDWAGRFPLDLSEFPRSAASRNLVRFWRHPAFECNDDEFVADYAFRDAYSRVSVLKSPRTAPGPDECFVHYDCHARLLFSKLLGVEVAFPGLDAARAGRVSLYNAMNYYRSHVEEVFYPNGILPLPPLEGWCRMHYDDTDVLTVAYVLRNTSRGLLPLRARWFSEPAPHEGMVCEVRQDGFTVSVEQRVHRTYRASAALRPLAPEVRFAREGARFASNWVEHALGPGEQWETVIRAGFGMDAPPPSADRLSRERRTLRAAVAQTERAYGHLPPLPDIFRRYEPLVLKAAGCLLSLRCQERSAAGASVPAIHVVRTGIGACYFWDSAFTLMGLGLIGELAPARGTVELLAEAIDESGIPPVCCHAGVVLKGWQEPVLAWGIAQVEALCDDHAFLERVYPALGRYVRCWIERYDANGNGVVEHPSRGVCWDDSLRWQEVFPIAFEPGSAWYERNWGRSAAQRFEHPDTNAHLALECRALAGFARRLGRADDAAAWDARAGALAEAVNRVLYSDEHGTFMDRCTDGRFSGLVTPASFLPVYADLVPVPRAAAMCRRYLLDPAHFYTTLPFPTLDRSHPAFRSAGFLRPLPEHPGALINDAYWNGRAWPHVSFWMVGALHRAGLASEADAAADRILDAIGRSEAIHECYDSLTGYGAGHAEYNWSCAAVLALAYRYYRRDPLPFAGPAGD